MSSLYKRPKSPYYMWSTVYKGRKIARSTKMTSKTYAKKVQTEWDLNLILGNTEFLGFDLMAKTGVTGFIYHYLNFIESRKSEGTVAITKGVMKRFLGYIKQCGIRQLDEITVVTIDGFLDSMDIAPKSKKNYLGIVRLLFNQAIKEGLLKVNPTLDATVPKIIVKNPHRLLEQIDLEIIFQSAGQWYNYYQFLLHTGLRAGDVSILKFGNIDRKKKAIVSLVRKSRRVHEFPLADCLLDLLPKSADKDTPLFPKMYAEDEKRLNWKLKAPRKHLQSMLRLNGREKADLHSFRVTFNNTLRDLGLTMDDRQVLLAHATSETTKIYTHPNFALAQQFVNKIPVYKG